MSPHEELQSDIPEYVLSKLEPGVRGRLEAHLRECDSCAGLVESCRQIASALRETGAVIFSPHPDGLTLRDCALGGEASRHEPVARHVAWCAECALDVEVWKSREGARAALPVGSPRRAAPRQLALVPLAALALAAGVVMGIGVTLFLRPGVAPRPGMQSVAPGASARSEAWSGPAPLIVLGTPRRGEGSRPAFRTGADQPWVLIAVQPILPSGAPDTELYRFEIRSGEGDEAWHFDLTASQVRRQLGASDVAAFMVPSASLPAARYQFRLLRLTSAGAEPLMEIPFEIVR